MHERIKKCCIIITVLALLIVSAGSSAAAENENYEIGDYYLIGQYNNEPILWRYVSNDENGMLLVSEKVICFKRFNSPQEGANYYHETWSGLAYWGTSNIRAWLNSSAEADKVIWLDNNPPISAAYYVGYDEEAGFLSDGNFTQSERNLMKSVTQWTMLPCEKRDLSENGLTECYLGSVIKSGSGSGRDGTEFIEIPYKISEFPNVYYGAAFQSTDTMFLLDELQLYAIWENFGSVNALRTDEAKPNEENDGKYANYNLRSGCNAWTADRYGRSGVSGETGVRPAFYLDSNAINTITGSGTESDPYILNVSGGNSKAPGNNSNSVSVMLNNQKLTFAVPPIMENDRVLVPFRVIFEAIGAEVGWNGDTNTVTAEKGDMEMSLQIDNKQITINGKHITLDVPPRLVGSRTLVPVRAVSEGLGATVDWDDVNNRVIIITND